MTKILDRIQGPEDIKKLSPEDLSCLAQELREYIIEVVAKNGGHLASNLGVVELTLALFRTFDFPEDKVVWDVGHQSYTYKILADRKEAFKTLRLWQGLSGFPKTEESPYDAFNTGHSSTSISAALGILRAERSQGNENYVLAVIGDGALTGGMSFEALNDAGQGDENLIVIINDNQMSISENVGGLQKHLQQLRMSQSYLDFKSKAEEFLLKIPLIGKGLAHFFSRVKKNFRRRISPPIYALYESLGFKYYGPIDGHDIQAIETALDAAKFRKGPTVIHVCTVKGKGYSYAMHKPSSYHGVAPFEVEKGVLEKDPVVVVQDKTCSVQDRINKSRSYGEGFSYILQHFAMKEDRIVGICAAMAQGTMMEEFSTIFPERFYDVGIAEQHAVTLASGMAQGGLRPVVAIYATFLQRALDQVMHDVVLNQEPVIFCIDRAGVVGEDGETHQGLYDLAFLRSLPYGTIFTPRSNRDFYRMFSYALGQAKGPIFIRYPKGKMALSLEDDLAIKTYLENTGQDKLPVTSAQWLSGGKDLTIISWGYTTGLAYQSMKALAEEGIEAAVVDLREIHDIDPALVEKALSCPCLIVEEAIYPGSVGEDISAIAYGKKLQTPLQCINIPNHPVLQGPRNLVLDQLGISVDHIVEEGKKLLGR